MKKSIFILFLISLNATAQSWQWGKRGGSTDNLNASGGTKEEVTHIVTDSQNNIYMISAVGKNGLDVDGNPKNYYGDPGSFINDEIVLASFGCDGSYRWSKIIGGEGSDRVTGLKIDSQDNVYISGNFFLPSVDYPPRIDDDIIISQTPLDYSITFIAKFSNTGVFQWLKRPAPSSTTYTASTQVSPYDLYIDSQGGVNWLVELNPGTYCDGQFVTTSSVKQTYILKYDSNGNFISGLPLDMKFPTETTFNLKFNVNPYNGGYYISLYKISTAATVFLIGGQSITNSAFLACFNNLGQFQWVRESSTPNPSRFKIYDISFDSNNNIYMGGTILGFNGVSFVGFSVPEQTQPQFVLKLNPTATTVIWSTYYTIFDNAYQYGQIDLKNNEVSLTGRCAGTLTWGSQTVVAYNGINQGSQPLLARFNKDTGTCIGLHNIVNNLQTVDHGTALTVDSNGDYIMGGSFGSQLNFTTNTINATGAQSDFFIAKFSTSVCSLGVEDFKEQGLELAPNPVEKSVLVRTKENLNYELFTILGNKIKEGSLSELQNSIDVSDLAAGSYILKTTDNLGKVKSVKLLKQ
ncbi:T9SS type A sorting domain-containing protein [Flavobacterium sp.]|uniref:T9SS type A sorting domain-containing protein n=1 Tax=Flavobacterium sp. TaxID=239 RepID=UPI0037509ACF